MRSSRTVSIALMNCFSHRWRRTAPMQASSRNELVSSKPARMNGWSWPPQAFQVVGWLVFIYLAIVSFGIYIPLLPLPWNHLTGITFIVHFFTHIAAVTIDPADASVRAKQSYSKPMPLFDSTKQRHVIQDLHCYLCDVKHYLDPSSLRTAPQFGGEMSMSDIKSWNRDADEEAQWPSVKSAANVPGVQDPLGSSRSTDHRDTITAFDDEA
ncbi:hypothetical protein INR49_024138 [Caranx melampygus]|nr:hypothetical protein INR49_024138 [Caranx melampygus]